MGTSTLFLDSIVKHGLGGANPISDWNVVELAREILELSQEHISKSDMFARRGDSFRRMTEQIAGTTNWQHGDTYVSPVKHTAIRYVANKRLGSELLTYTLDFLEELVRYEVPGVKDSLYRRFPQAFRVLDLSCSPILLEASGVPVSWLIGEDGSDASSNLKRIDDAYHNHPDIADAIIQQENFRLRQPIPINKLRIWLVNISKFDPILPKVTLYELK